MLTDEQLKKIAARAEGATRLGTNAMCPASDIPALLAHIEHQRRALEWIDDKAMQLCHHNCDDCCIFDTCPIGVKNRDDECADIGDWAKSALNATKDG